MFSFFPSNRGCDDTPADQLAAHDDAALGEAHLLADLRHLVPPGLAQGRCDELGADVTFTEAFLVHCSGYDISTKLQKAGAARRELALDEP